MASPRPLLDPSRHEPIERRRDHVPRFLFRAWHARSGGGPDFATNSTSEIVPHAFMPGKQRDIPTFYEAPETMLYWNAINHYHGNACSDSEFSSWASSLHLVLCYATYKLNKKDPHIAIMDTHNLDGNILVWHVPDLIGQRNHEYLAWGQISGRGYKAVSLYNLHQKGLKNVFPELELCTDTWGTALRHEMFSKPLTKISREELDVVRNIASPFGDLSLPVAVALVCIRPKSLLTSKMGGQNRSISNLMVGLRITKLPVEFQKLHQERWLEPGMVDTKGFSDVEQWICLFDRILKSKYLGQMEAKNEPNDEDVWGNGRLRPRDVKGHVVKET
ncbi:hypothetical protein P153DRAFT_380733 [Dothidotthia symphoricarpi CBS 119687]|uniref:DUF7587 domain-containing protein n=1 Tax=Dothidotthia symphoricarpi CBS 119687 TaxID=1392245 RepID=A0A6A6ATL1_9PLEO|nr:uncharacterized protein P153DRAFT_380733 [Dothidotthia symphoricarpi CBS 119687]KAF2134926.1 hypothetical protein P153DRAFT_380733 [Dothidotthia symphoricarpi CBS 119687]